MLAVERATEQGESIAAARGRYTDGLLAAVTRSALPSCGI